MPVEPTRSTSDVRARVAFGRAGVGFCASADVKRLETIAAARRADMTVRADDFTLKTSVGFLDVLPGVDVSMPPTEPRAVASGSRERGSKNAEQRRWSVFKYRCS